MYVALKNSEQTVGPGISTTYTPGSMMVINFLYTNIFQIWVFSEKSDLWINSAGWFACGTISKIVVIEILIEDRWLFLGFQRRKMNLRISFRLKIDVVKY